MIHEETKNPTIDHFILSIQISLKTIIYSKNWIFYSILTLLPILFTLPVNDKLLGADSGTEAFLGIVLRVQLTIFFTFGCLFIALPISSDNISDHTMDLFITRPIRREILYLSKWVALILCLVFFNFLIILSYYIYFQFFDPNLEFISGIMNNLDILFYVLIFIIAESLIYGSLFLIIGMIGSRGFSLGIFVAFFELIISNMLFLADDPNMPRTNLTVIAENLFNEFIDISTEGLPSFEYSVTYLFVVSALLVILGIFFFKRKELN